MRSRVSVFLCLLLALPSLAQDDKEKKKHPLPFHPVAGAKVGDWSTVVYTMGLVMSGERKRDTKSVLTFTVSKVTDTGVMVICSSRAATGDARRTRLNYSLETVPTLEGFIGGDFLPPMITLTEVETTDAEKTVGGKAWQTKKVAFKSTDGTTAGALWLSPDVKGLGVALEVEVTKKTIQMTHRYELVGHGTADEKPTWGKRGSEVTLDAR